jgi:hypothetical protein
MENGVDEGKTVIEVLPVLFQFNDGRGLFI